MKLLGGLLSETASLRLRIRMRDARRDGMSVAQSVRARTFCVDFTYFHIHCEFHCEVKCEMVQSFHCEITFPDSRLFWEVLHGESQSSKFPHVKLLKSSIRPYCTVI